MALTFHCIASMCNKINATSLEGTNSIDSIELILANRKQITEIQLV